MIGNLFTALALIAAGQGGPAQPNESFIPNVRSEGIETWAADGDRGVYILGRDGTVKKRIQGKKSAEEFEAEIRAAE